MDILLWRWDQIKAGTEATEPRLRELLQAADRTELELKKALGLLAFKVHGESRPVDGETLADIKEVQLVEALLPLHPAASRDWVRQLIAAIKLRAGLVLERLPGIYTFPHRTFQEYLAGLHLSFFGDFSTRAKGLLATDFFWREVVLLAVGRLVYVQGELDKALALAAELCPARERDEEEAWRHAWLAGDVLLEIGVNRTRDSNQGLDLLERVRGRLVRLIELGRMRPVERAGAGRTLARLGDPRPGVGLRADGLPDIDWLEISGQSYEISRYPVTVAQYRAFMAAGGYEQERYWSKTGWAWRVEQKVVGPEDYFEVFQTYNHPRVGVSWYEAKAFCTWLSEKLGYEVALPTEAQWERAARHTDGRTYPWGEAKDVRQRCNVYKTGINATSTVGIFPNGNAVCGAADLAGNVWEWSADRFGEYSPGLATDSTGLSEGAQPVLRGGSWFSNVWNCGSANRVRNEPVDRIRYIGFRLARGRTAGPAEPAAG